MTIAILLLGLGLLLIIGELLFPTLGALGVAAAACILGAIAVAFGESQSLGISFLVATAIGVPLSIFAGVRLLPRSPFGRTLVSPGYSFTDGAAVDRRDADLLGKEGVTENLLRPTGTALLDGRRVDVLTRGEPIEAGSRVRVVEIEGNRVVVVRTDAERRT